MHNDLTVAYVAIGAAEVWDSAHSDRFEGQLRFIDAVIAHAPTLHTLAEGREFDGVFVYDVAETFGRLYGRALIERTGKAAQTIATELINAHSTLRPPRPNFRCRQSKEYWMDVRAENIEEARDIAAISDLSGWHSSWSDLEAEELDPKDAGFEQ